MNYGEMAIDKKIRLNNRKHGFFVHFEQLSKRGNDFLGHDDLTSRTRNHKCMQRTVMLIAKGDSMHTARERRSDRVPDYTIESKDFATIYESLNLPY